MNVLNIFKMSIYPVNKSLVVEITFALAVGNFYLEMCTGFVKPLLVTEIIFNKIVAVLIGSFYLLCCGGTFAREVLVSLGVYFEAGQMLTHACRRQVRTK